MKILQPTYLFILLLCMFSCEPLPFDTTDDEPEFSTIINLGGTELAFEAGVDDYVMTTEFFNVAGYITYTGTLEHKSDPFNNPQFALRFRISENARNTDTPDHLESFKVGEYPFYTIDDALLPSPEVSFTADYEGSGMNVSYAWDYGDGAAVNFRRPIHAYPSTDDTYEAEIKVSDDNQCIATARNTVTFDNRSDCYAKIEVISISESIGVLEATSTGVEPFYYQWFDGSSASDVSIDIADSSENQSYCVTITDALGCTSINCAGIIRDESGQSNSCTVEMTETNFNKARTAIQFDAVEVFWNDNAPGSRAIELSSQELQQGADAYFRITSFEEFEMNPVGNRTVKFDFELKCTMYETLASGPVPLEVSGSMAVAIPN